MCLIIGDMKTPGTSMGLVVLPGLVASTGVGQDFGGQQVITTSAVNAACVHATDLDGDGDADVLSASGRDDKIAWYENLMLQVESYCACVTGAPCGNTDSVAGCANSSGAGALLSASGSSLVTLDNLVLTAESVPAQQFGLLFMGYVTTEVPFGDGKLCITPSGIGGVYRYGVQSSGASGVLGEGPGIVAYSHAAFGGFRGFGAIAAGETWNFQAWYRDPGGPCGSAFNLSNALAVTFVP